MLTYQDFLLSKTESDKAEFILYAIADHESSELYNRAKLAYEYYLGNNPTIMATVKYLQKITGEKVVDLISPNHKCGNNLFRIFIQQENFCLLSNGVNFKEPSTKDAIGGSKFDLVLQKMGKSALRDGVCFGFLNKDEVIPFPIYSKTAPCFCPIYDEETGNLALGIRYWAIDEDKPLRVTFYEQDGYTDYRFPKDGQYEIIGKKNNYLITTGTSQTEGRNILGGENYSDLPIIPFYGNPEHVSELTPMLQNNIDSYDITLSGLVNLIDDTSEIVWILKNVAGMDQSDAVKFKETIHNIRVAFVDNDNGDVKPTAIDVPYSAREVTLERLRRQMYENYGAVDVSSISGGNLTATQIKSSYELLNYKVSEFESCAYDFVNGILGLLNINDTPSFTRETIANVSEEIDNVLKGAENLSQSYVTKKLLTFLGDIDSYDEVMQERQTMESGRLENIENSLQKLV